MNRAQAGLVAFGVAAVAIMGSCGTGVYSSVQHDRRIQAGFRDAVLKNPKPHLMTVETDGVKRQGFLNVGAAFRSQSSETALILAGSPESKCWYTTLRVVEGQEKLPFLQKIGGGAEPEVMYANQAFHNSAYDCIPTSDGQTIENFQQSATEQPDVERDAPGASPTG